MSSEFRFSKGKKYGDAAADWDNGGDSMLL